MEVVRLRRLRRIESIRELIAETRLQPAQLILPYFVVEGRRIKKEIKSMPGVFHLSVDNLLRDVEEAIELGIRAILLFGITELKDEKGTQAYARDGVVQRAIREIKKNFRELVVIADLCLCGYTSHGHCGLLTRKNSSDYPEIDEEATLKVFSQIALAQASAGAELVAPSGMMDGQVGAIRRALDEKGFHNLGILAYSAKYASSFYGPFRDALSSAPRFGDRRSYQMDYRNSREALREMEQDVREGADIIMVKPALAYLDIIWRAKKKFNLPIAGYNVSGEYSMLKFYVEKMARPAERKKLERELALEVLTSIKRAGADLIITYWAKEVARWLS